MGVRTAILVILVAIGMYFLLRPAEVVLTSSVFMYRDPEFVYKKLSDIDINIKHHQYGHKGTLIESFKKDNGILVKKYEVTERIPLGFFDWKYTLVFDTFFELIKPGKEINMHYHIWYAGLTGNITRIFTPKSEEGGPGCQVEETMVITTPWITSHYVLYHAKATHPDSLYHMKLTIESMHEYFNEKKE
ncbi:hypothetical protein HOLleu_09722 [Holothuria leucospilota]|uniref:Uncharacterized protein n=1 Tax=Holothuria leucospilota TaxID=206669 RepID=A0A9Q1HF65_HOLLE|nr:hypothetical protein HOLleu_09722 [Holothuria leucospilota]